MGVSASAMDIPLLQLAFFIFLSASAYAVPSVLLITPSNGESTTEPMPAFSWVATDDYSPQLTCNLYIDDSVAIENVRVSSGSAYSAKMNTPMSSGAHRWAVSCWDTMQGSNASETRTLFKATVQAAALAVPTEFIPVFVTASGKQPGSLSSASLIDELFSWPTILVFPLTLMPALFMIFLIMSKRQEEGHY